MLNKEKYAKEILDIACKGKCIAVDLIGNIKICEPAFCKDCKFSYKNNGGRCSCVEALIEWANSEYVETSVDWSKVPVDTPILVRSNKNAEWAKRYFARYEKGKVLAWSRGTTSWTAYNKLDVCEWNYAKLAENEEV